MTDTREAVRFGLAVVYLVTTVYTLQGKKSTRKIAQIIEVVFVQFDERGFGCVCGVGCDGCGKRMLEICHTIRKNTIDIKISI